MAGSITSTETSTPTQADRNVFRIFEFSQRRSRSTITRRPRSRGEQNSTVPLAQLRSSFKLQSLRIISISSARQTTFIVVANQPNCKQWLVIAAIFAKRTKQRAVFWRLAELASKCLPVGGSRFSLPNVSQSHYSFVNAANSFPKRRTSESCTTELRSFNSRPSLRCCALVWSQASVSGCPSRPRAGDSQTRTASS
jgi:hypothetical protein